MLLLQCYSGSILRFDNKNQKRQFLTSLKSFAPYLKFQSTVFLQCLECFNDLEVLHTPKNSDQQYVYKYLCLIYVSVWDISFNIS